MLTNRLNVANTSMFLINPIESLPYAQDFTCMDSNVGCLAGCTAGRLMDHDGRIGQCISLSGLAYKCTFCWGEGFLFVVKPSFFFFGLPAASNNDPIEQACPLHKVDTGDWIYYTPMQIYQYHFYRQFSYSVCLPASTITVSTRKKMLSVFDPIPTMRAVLLALKMLSVTHCVIDCHASSYAAAWRVYI